MNDFSVEQIFAMFFSVKRSLSIVYFQTWMIRNIVKATVREKKGKEKWGKMDILIGIIFISFEMSLLKCLNLVLMFLISKDCIII